MGRLPILKTESIQFIYITSGGVACDPAACWLRLKNSAWRFCARCLTSQKLFWNFFVATRATAAATGFPFAGVERQSDNRRREYRKNDCSYHDSTHIYRLLSLRGGI
jgi:hypothetical protein